MTLLARILALDLGALAEKDLKWLHDLRNRATVLAGRRHLKRAKKAEHVLEKSDPSRTKA